MVFLDFFFSLRRTHIAHYVVVDGVGLTPSLANKMVVAAIPVFHRQCPAAPISICLPACDLLWSFAVFFGEFTVRSCDPVVAVLWGQPTS